LDLAAALAASAQQLPEELSAAYQASHRPALQALEEKPAPAVADKPEPLEA